MKNSTFNNRIRKSNSGRKGKEIVRALLSGESFNDCTGKVRPCWTSGCGRFTTNLNYTMDALNVLHHLGMECNVHYTLENDAARGSVTGNYLVLTSKGKRKMIK